MQLRERTGISVMECKKALEEAGGDFDKAMEILSSRAATTAAKKSDRALGAGVVSAYVHGNGQLGTLVVLSCETDFVAKNEEFTKLAYDLAMHVAAMRPQNTEELMIQAFVKDPSKTVADLLSSATQKFGERVAVSQVAFLGVRE